jgi:hypothetical protein
MNFFAIVFVVGSMIFLYAAEEQPSVNMERLRAVEQPWVEYKRLWREVYRRSKEDQPGAMTIVMLPDMPYQEAYKRYCSGYYTLNQAEKEE